MRLNSPFRTDRVTAPVNVQVLGEFPVSEVQSAGVRQAYAKFSANVARSAFPDGFHSQTMSLADGTLISMVSVNGVHQIAVRPTGGVSQEEETLHGIGLAFTQRDGVPHASWRTGDELNGFKPQPIIIKPNDKGGWDVKKVKKLVGGNDLWVSADRKSWYSHYKIRTSAPDATTYHPLDKFYPKYYKPWFIVEGRAAITMVNQKLIESFNSSGYVMKGNQTLMLRNYQAATQMFDTKVKFNGAEVAGVGYVHVNPDNRAVLLLRGPRVAVAGIETNYAATDSSYFGYSELFISPTYINVIPQTLSVNPAGTLATFLATVPPDAAPQYALVQVTLGKVPAFTVAKTYTQPAVTGVQQYSASHTQTSVPKWTMKNITAGAGCIGGTINLRAVDAVGADVTIAGTYQKTLTGVCTGSLAFRLFPTPGNYITAAPYFAPNGDVVEPQFKTTSSYTEDVTVSDVRSRLGNRDTATRIETNKFRKEFKYELMFPKVTVVTHDSFWSGTFVKDVHRTNTNNEVGTAANSHVARGTERSIVFYDHVTDFLVTCVTVWDLTMTSDVWDPRPYGAQQSAFSHTAGTISYTLEARFGEALVQSIALPSHAVNRTESGPGYLVDVAWMIKSQGTLISTKRPIMIDVDYAAVGGNCIDSQGNASGEFYVPKTTSMHFGDTYDESLSWSRNDPGGAAGSPNSFRSSNADEKLAVDYIESRFARDPVSLSVLVNVTFAESKLGDGGSDKSWWWAVSPSGVKSLSSILNAAGSNPTIPTTEDLIIWEQAGIHSLVSI